MPEKLSVKEVNRLWAKLTPRVARASEEATRNAERILQGPEAVIARSGRRGGGLNAGAAMALAVFIWALFET